VRVPREEARKYGVIQGKEVAPRIWKIKRAVEKPSPGKEPSNLAIVVKYIVTPEFLPYLARVKPAKGEFHIPPAIEAYVKHGGSFYGYETEGQWYDCGSKLGYMKGVVRFGLAHPEIGKEFKKYLEELALK